MTSGPELPAELDRLAEEFVARERRGEQPTISEYVRRHPDLEAGIREVFPLLAVMEGVKLPSETGLPQDGKGELDPAIERLGDYRLVREVGRGGMGVVYEAVQETLGRRVALKVLPPSAMLDPQFVERFRIEAQAAARLHHPNIVPVIGLGEDRGTHYYTMQFIDGHGLDEILAETREILDTDSQPSESGAARRLFTADLTDASNATDSSTGSGALAPTVPPSTDQRPTRASRRRYYRNIARIGLQTADALAFAHARGVLHRDVKPSNVILDERGRAWIADFGLCRDESSADLTQTGDLVGTLRYMAPECFQGEHDVRSDVYGLGLILYELLTSSPAYADVHRAALVRRITQDALPKLRARTPDVPADLATIVQKAIAHDPAVRYPTADALASDLRAFLEGRPIAARAPSLGYVLRASVRRHRPLAATLVVAALALVLTSVFYLRNLKEKENRARLRQYAASIAAAETAIRDGDLPRARKLLDQASPEFRDWEWRHLVSRLEPGVRSFASVSPFIAASIAHSPDGRWLAVGHNEGVRVYDHASGEIRAEFATANQAECVAWRGDSCELAAGAGMTLRVWSWPDGEALGTLEWEDRIQGLAFDARRGRLLVGAEDCRVVALDQGTLEVVGECAFPSKVYAVEVSRDGEQVAVGRLDGRLSMLEAESLTPLWSSRVSPRGVLNVAFIEPDLVVGTAYDGVVRVLHRSTGNVARILPHQEQLWDVAARPDGSLIATLERGGHLHLWETRTGRRLEPRHQGREVSVVSFHPEGRRVVTGSWAGTLIEWDCERGRDRHVLGPHIDEATTVAVHPHGRLAVTGGVCGAVRVWDLETGEIVRTWPGHAWHIRAAAFSPDGQSLATGDAARRASVHVRRFPDGEVLHRFDGLGDGVFGLGVLAGGRTLLAAGGDGVLRAWGLEAGMRERELVVSAEPLRALALHPRGDLVALAGDSGDISLVDIERWTVRRKLVGHAVGVRGLAFDPTGEVLASAGTDQTTRLWTVSTGAPLRVLTEANPDHGEHTDAIHCVTFHPSGTRLLTGSRTSAIDVWDWRRGALLSTMRGHTGWILALTFSPGGARMLSASTDGTARIWDTRSRSERSAGYAPVARPRAEAARILDARIAEHGDLEAALESLEGDRRLDARVREEALCAAHGRRGSRAGLGAWAWQALAPPDAEPRRQRAAYAIGHGFARATDIRALPDGEGYLLTGMAEARLKRPHAQYYLERSLDMNAGQPELRVVALLFLSFALADEDLAEARRRLEAAETLLEQQPEVRTRRVESILAEARERLAR